MLRLSLVVVLISLLSSQAFASKQDTKIIIGDLDWVEITQIPENDEIRMNANAVGLLSIPKIGSRCTAFLVSEDTVMTNHHCISDATYAEGATVSFKVEKGVMRREQETFDCSEFVGNYKELDIALLKCKGRPGDYMGIVELSTGDVKEQVEEKVYVVQQNCDYYTLRNCAPTKKVSAGNIVKYQGRVLHNADTLGGSSGSPVFSMTSHKVVALHNTGYGNDGNGRGTVNGAVPMAAIVKFLKSNMTIQLKGIDY